MSNKVSVSTVVVLCAFRYALGRKTSATSMVIETIKENIDAFDNDYNKVITQSKKIYRYDKIFYIGTIYVGNQVSYVSYSQMDINTNPKIKPIEKWTFEKRWIN